MWSGIIEGITMLVVINLLNNTGHENVVLPGIVMVVGLHFLPMAFAIPFRPFFVLSAVLIATSLAGFIVQQPTGSIVAGLAAAIALWAASVAALRRAQTVPPA